MRELTKRERRTLLASVLRQPGRIANDSPLIDCGGDGAGRPLILLPYEEGHARALATERPVFALPASRLPIESEPGFIPAVARWYVDELYRAGLSAPFQIVGYCFAGIVAFEMARLLREDGHAVDHLELIETPAPGRSYGRYLERQRWLHPLRSLRLRLLREIKERVPWKPRDAELAATAERGDTALDPITAAALDDNLMKTTARIAATHEALPYSGALQLVFAEDSGVRDFVDPSAGWKGLIGGGLRSDRAAGDHISVFLSGAFLPGLRERLRALEQG